MLEKIEFELKKEDFGSEYAGKYTFVGIGWGGVNRISGECTKVEPASRRSETDIKMLNARLIMATLLEKPKIITLNHLLDETSNGLPPGLGDLFMAATDKVNGYGREERERVKKLKEQWDLD